MAKSLLPSRPTFIIAVTMVLVALAIAAVALSQRPTKGPAGSGTALIGGPFTMVDGTGKGVTEKNFKGRYALYVFGFTFCPDVCPTEMQVITAALKEMGAKGDKLTPVFVSVDPDRDTPQIVGQYVANFDPRWVGLTGTAEQLAAMAKAFHVFYQKVPNAKDPQNYEMDHSSIIYLMGPDGTFVKHFPYTTDAKVLASSLNSVLE
ncbi:MAG: SCO family protein [Alphaproteobacteria bacterium]|nr:SCO family protein [Alphaproteobacteria bacterium]